MKKGKICRALPGGGTEEVDHAYCDFCGWGDTCRPDVETPFGTFDLCHRHKPADVEKTVRRINALINTSVDDCRGTIQHIHNPYLLQTIIKVMDRDNIEGKSRRQVIERRIRQIKKRTSPCA